MEFKNFIPESWTQFKTLFKKFFKKTFVGTRAEWNALPLAEKTEYDICNLTDDTAGGELVVTDAVTAGDLNPVTSNAVYNALDAKFITESERTANVSMASMIYGCIDTNLSITKAGYTLVSACAYVEYSDAILCSVYPYSGGKFRITYFNTATNPQTVPVIVKLLWMKN
jgi:hypothetical protein